MAGWEPDTTRWLAERIALGDGRRWYLDEQHQGEHLWYPADNAPT
ncbi:MAG: hypothetical protein QM753_02085 [Thermomicrobiales bacterium]